MVIDVIGVPFQVYEAKHNRVTADALELGAPAFRAAYDDGRLLSVDDAIAMGLGTRMGTDVSAAGGSLA